MVPRRGHTDCAPRRRNHGERTSGSRYRRCGDLVRSDWRPGSATAVIQAASLVQALKFYDGKLTYKWLLEQFESTGSIAATGRPKLRGCSSAIRNMQRTPSCCFQLPPSTGISVLRSSACSPNRGRCLLQSREAVLNFISDLAGEPAENLLGRFKSPQQFTRARSAERATVPA